VDAQDWKQAQDRLFAEPCTEHAIDCTETEKALKASIEILEDSAPVDPVLLEDGQWFEFPDEDRYTFCPAGLSKKVTVNMGDILLPAYLVAGGGGLKFFATGDRVKPVAYEK
jgi:hypothetical protein